MSMLHLHNSISIRQILFLWLTLCMLPGIAQATGSHFNEHRQEQSYNRYQHGHDFGKRLTKRSQKRCNTQCDNNVLTIPLLADTNIQVGVIKVTYDEHRLNVKYVANDGWRIEKTRLAVTDSYSGIPQDYNGNPQVQNFPLKTSHRTPVQMVNHMLSSNRWPVGTELYIAAQVDVISLKPQASNGSRRHARSWSYARNNESDRYDGNDNNHFSARSLYAKNKFRLLKALFSANNSENKRDDHRHNAACRWGKDHEKHSKQKSVSTWAGDYSFPGDKGGFYFTYVLRACNPVSNSHIQFSSPVYTGKEGNHQARIILTRTGDLSKAATVRFKTSDGTAIDGVDYVGLNDTVSFNPDTTQALVTVEIIDDGTVEETKTVNLQLHDAKGAALGEQDTAVLEIQDNDELPPRYDSFVFEPAQYIARESDDLAVLTVKRIGSLFGEASVDFAATGGSAKNGIDYVLMPGTLVFADGVDSATIVVTIKEDRAPEGDETVSITLVNPVNGVLGNPVEAVLVIEDNEGPN